MLQMSGGLSERIAEILLLLVRCIKPHPGLNSGNGGEELDTHSYRVRGGLSDSKPLGKNAGCSARITTTPLLPLLARAKHGVALASKRDEQEPAARAPDVQSARK